MSKQHCRLLLRQCTVLGNNVEATFHIVERTKFQRKTRSTLLPFLATKSNVASTLLLVWTGLNRVRVRCEVAPFGVGGWCRRISLLQLHHDRHHADVLRQQKHDSCRDHLVRRALHSRRTTTGARKDQAQRQKYCDCLLIGLIHESAGARPEYTVGGYSLEESKVCIRRFV